MLVGLYMTMPVLSLLIHLISLNRMQKIILWFVVGIILVAVGYYGVTYKASHPKNETTTPEVSGKRTTFAEFLKRNDTGKCSVTQDISGIETTGTILTFNGMMRGEFGSEINGKIIKTDFLVRDGYNYTWTSTASDAGFKAKTTSLNKVRTDPELNSIWFNADTVVEYDCQPWLADQTKFLLPLGVTFKDVTKQ